MHSGAVRDKRLAASDGGVRELLADLEKTLGDRRTARELLAALWDKSPGWVAAHGNSGVPSEIETAAVAAAQRVAAGEPLAYATGRVGFRKLTLSVDHRVLIPRSETEIVVEEALRVCSTGVAVDVGTGSGAIALALADEGSFERIIATDVSSDALAVARLNAAAAGADRLEFRCGSLLRPLGGERADLIVCNPPYLAAGEMGELPALVRDWEPVLALFAGEDGLAHTRTVIAQAAHNLKPGGWLVLECDSRRTDAVSGLLEGHSSYSDVRIRQDLAGRPRVAVARRRALVTTEIQNAG